MTRNAVKAIQPRSVTGAPRLRAVPSARLLADTERRLYRTFNVLVLDDDDDMLAMLVSYLELCPIFTVTAVVTVDEARERLRGREWHCWILDLYVPDVRQGLALIEQAAPRVPVVVLSGQSSGSEGYRCGQHGAQEFLDKGLIEADQLNDMVFSLCLKKMLAPDFPFADPLDPRTITLNGLFAGDVHSVSQWADNCGISPRFLAQRAHDACALTPQQALLLYRRYRIAQRYCRNAGREPFVLSASERVVLGRFFWQL